METYNSSSDIWYASVGDVEAHVSRGEQLRPSDRSASDFNDERQQRGDEAEGGREAAGRREGGTDIKGDFTVQIKIYHNRKGLRHGGCEGRGGDAARALFTIFNMQSRHPSSPPPPCSASFCRERARVRQRVRV